jgi:hypothetical protein
MVVEAATGRRELSEEDLERIAEHVAEARFDPDQQIRAGKRLGGLYFEKKLINENDLLSSSNFHYLLHVRFRREWPIGTTKEAYEQSIRTVINDPERGILVSRYRDRGWQLAFVRRSGEFEGPRENAWILVEYNLNYGFWTTAFQPEEGLAHLERPEREDAKWLRRPV